MNSAGKLQVAMELYNSGMLCKCSNWIEIEDEWLDESEKVLQACEDAGMLPPVVEGIVKVETDGEELVVRPWRWENEK